MAKSQFQKEKHYYIVVAISIIIILLFTWSTYRTKKKDILSMFDADVVENFTTTSSPLFDNLIVVYGSYSDSMKVSASSSSTIWSTQFTNYPNSLTSPDVLVILINTSRSLTCKFNVPTGTYYFTVKYLAPSGSANSVFMTIDQNTRVIGDFTSYALGPLTSSAVGASTISSYSLSAGLHTAVFSYREPVGLIQLNIIMVEQTIENIIVPFIDMVLSPDNVYTSTTTTTSAPITTTLTPTTTLIPTTTSAPRTTTLTPTTTLIPNVFYTTTSSTPLPLTNPPASITVVNVKDYGAMGDAVTDDTTSILNAFQYLSTWKNGGVLYFPQGIYVVNPSNDYLLYVKNQSNLNFRGDGLCSTIQIVDGNSFSKGIFNLSYSKNIAIENLTLDANSLKSTRVQGKSIIICE